MKTLTNAGNRVHVLNGLCSIGLFAAASCVHGDPRPPVAQRQPVKTEIHGSVRVDDYAWLRDRDDPQVIAYLSAENDYTAAVMKHTKGLQKRLYKEIKGRIKETDLSVPYRKGEYFYYTRTVEGRQYKIHARKRGSLDAKEEILLDQNKLAAGHDYFRVGGFRVSPDHNLLAYSTDTSGAESFTVYVKDLRTGKLLPDRITNTSYPLEWGNDNRTLFYTTQDAAKRPDKAFRHVLGVEEDVLIHHETDERFFVGIGKTRSERFLLLSLSSQITSEVHRLDANSPLAEFQVIQPRVQGMEYQVNHHGDFFYIVTNDQARNFKVVRVLVDRPVKENWEDVIPHRDDVKIDSLDAFANHLVVEYRQGGLRHIQIRDLRDGSQHEVEFPEPVYVCYSMANHEFETDTFRFMYTSMITPRSIFDYHMDSRKRVLKKQQEVLGGYDSSQYETYRLFAIAIDGTKVPITVVHRRGIKKDGRNPTLLYGYGSYGACMEPWFSSKNLSLLERGVVYAIAHVRGGGEMGRAWYENGKFLAKKNTFTDFIAVAEHLIVSGYTSPDRLAAQGASAGGLLMGAVANMRPGLFKAVLAQVPFVDVVNTMLDPTIPLTVIEYEEWGNPNDKPFYDYMLSYSPYDNVEAKAYPNMLITAGLNDPRVGYWEPAKWTAKLRRLKTDNNRLLLKTNMGAGHGGASGRYDSIKEDAFEFAFLLDVLGVTAR